MARRTSEAHTPGPWVLQGEGIVHHPVTHRAMTTTRIETSLGMIEILDLTNEPEANARLIAAAPALLGALEGIVRYLEHPDVQEIPFALRSGPVAKKIRKFISEVKGE